MLDLEQTIKTIDAWIAHRKSESNFPAGIKLSQARLEYALKNAQTEYDSYYFGYQDHASPFKTYACFCFAIATERPFMEENETNGQESIAIALINADLAMDFAGYLISVSTFDCAPDVKPPFKLKYPSLHFRKEMKKNLAWGNLTTPGLALLFELLIYREGAGINLCGALDRIPVS